MKGNRELIVSLHQTVVLMLFNDSDSLSFKDIVAATGLEKGEAERTVQSLAMGKVKVLKRKTTEKGKDLKDEDDIVFNTDFVSAQRRIKINTIQIKETKEEADATTERVLEGMHGPLCFVIFCFLLFIVICLVSFYFVEVSCLFAVLINFPRRSPSPDRCSGCANDEGEKTVEASDFDWRSVDPTSLPSESNGYQEENRVADREGVFGERRGRQEHIQVSGLVSLSHSLWLNKTEIQRNRTAIVWRSERCFFPVCSAASCSCSSRCNILS